MKNEGRINLCFNLDDVRQRTVYDFLRDKGRKKTVAVVGLVLEFMTKEAGEERDRSEKALLEHLERVVREGSAIPLAQEIRDEIAALNKRLDAAHISLSGSQKEDRASRQDQNHFIDEKQEMSDEAFAAFLSFTGSI